MKKILSGKQHPGITIDKTSFEALVKTKAQLSPIYVLEEHGTFIDTVDLHPNPVFVLGDHIGLPKTTERYTLRYATKISLAKRPYLAAQCMTVLNHTLDKKNNM
jgi:tRNA (pseudouridine54-N1)-methyltransferase